MFETIVANIINRLLGSYIENFDSKQLKIAIWKGDVKLKNLKLRNDTLKKFKVPFDLKLGNLGELTLQIPWSNLKSKPVKVFVENVFILVTLLDFKHYNYDEDTEIDLKIKREKLDNLENFQETLSQKNDDSNTNDSYKESLITTIIDNLQVTIKNIHIRYEYSFNENENPYSIGVTLDELSTISTDENWIPNFVSTSLDFTRKLLTLKNLSCYMNTFTDFIYKNDHDEIIKHLHKLIVTDESDNNGLDFLLKPVSGNGKIILHKKGSNEDFPQVKFDFFFKEFGIELSSDQYNLLLLTASKFHDYKNILKFRKFRPKTTPQETPLEWFLYVSKVIVNEIHEKNYKMSWDFFKKRRNERKSYIQLWKEKKTSDVFSSIKNDLLIKLENELSFNDIKLYRFLAHNELRKDKITLFNNQMESKSITKIKTLDIKNKQKDGWFSFLWGSYDKSTTVKANDTSDSTNDEFLDALDKCFYDVSDFKTGVDVFKVDYTSRSIVELEISISLEKGGICLKKKLNDSDLAAMIFEGCNVKFFKRYDSFLTNFEMHEFRIENRTSLNLFKNIVSVKQSDLRLNEKKINHEVKEPFFYVSFENNPLDGIANYCLVSKLNSIFIYYNSEFITKIISFFMTPNVNTDTIDALMNVAEATMEGITSQTRIALQYALEEHKTINVKLDIQTPLIIVPLDPEVNNSSVAVIDAGHISVTSNLVEKSRIEEIKKKNHYSQEDWNKLSNLMYDQFILDLKDAQFFVVPNMEILIQHLNFETFDHTSSILNKLDIKLLLGVSILPNVHNLSRFKLKGEVPEINLSLSDFHYKTIMKILENMVLSNDYLNTNNNLSHDFFSKIGNQSKKTNSTDENKSKTVLFSEQEKSDDNDSNVVKVEKNTDQRIFEFDLNVNIVNFFLLKCENLDTLKSKKIVNLVGEFLTLKFSKTYNEMNVNLILKDINLIDHVGKTSVPEFKKLISSNNFDDFSDLKKKELFKLIYKTTQKSIILNEKNITFSEQSIFIDFATVKFMISRNSVLSILNFFLDTFTNSNQQFQSQNLLKNNTLKNQNDLDQKLSVFLNLDSIILVLIENDHKLATIKLSTANIDVSMISEKIYIHGKLGALSLIDEVNQETSSNLSFKKLIDIHGDNLVEFSYQNNDNDSKKDFHSSIFEFKIGSVNINFIESSFSRILRYLNQFLKMKAVYDKARTAAINQANQINNPNQVKFNLLVHGPVITFPDFFDKDISKINILKIHLGEFYASNNFEIDEFNQMKNVIFTGIRKIGFFSLFFFINGIKQDLEIVDNLDISFNIIYLEKCLDNGFNFLIEGKMPEINLKLTEIQLKYLIKISKSITNLFSSLDSDDEFDILEEELLKSDLNSKNEKSFNKMKDLNKNKDIKEFNNLESFNPNLSAHKKVCFFFMIPKLSLTLYNKTSNLEFINKTELAYFSLNNLEIKFEMKQDETFESVLYFQSLTVRDIRTNTKSKFTELLPFISNNEKQFILKIKNTIQNICLISFNLTLDNPKVILVLDFIFEIQHYFKKGFEALDESIEFNNQKFDNTKKKVLDDKSINFHKQTIEKDNQVIDQKVSEIKFHIEINDLSVILLEDPMNESTQAIVFKVEKILYNKHKSYTINAKNIGIFLCGMDDFINKRYRIIDDFQITFFFDTSENTDFSLLTRSKLTIDPILIRISLRDIRLALGIFKKGSDIFNSFETASKNVIIENDLNFNKKVTKYSSSKSIPTLKNSDQKFNHKLENVLIGGEEFFANIGGVRLVLIGDVHELPVIDINLKSFQLKVLNWSTDLVAETHFESYVNIFNYARFSWEPLIETWQFSIYAFKKNDFDSSLNFVVVSRKIVEITITSRSLSLISQISSLIASDKCLKPRGQDNPYRIINETGYDIEIWIDTKKKQKKNKLFLKYNHEIPWTFEDWRKIRENLNIDNEIGFLAIKMINSPYQEVNKISAIGEGDELFILNPPLNGIHNRLVCQINLENDNITTICLRSTIQIHNSTEIPIVIKFFKDINDESNIKEFLIESNSTKSMPIDFVYLGSFKLKPFIDSDQSWSDKFIHWRDLLNEPKSIFCSTANLLDHFYYFQCEAIYDRNNKQTKIYPHMKIIIFAPLKIENCLPFDINYRLYDKVSEKNWNGAIYKGVNKSIHFIDLNNFLLLSIEPLGCGFHKSEFVIINAPSNGQFKKENKMVFKHDNGQVLKLRIHHSTNSISKIGLNIVLYSPYIIMNKTGLTLFVSEKNSKIECKILDSDKIVPFMFSFNKFNDKKNRALIKTLDSNWSPSLSFDATEQSKTLKLISTETQKEINLGLSILEGEGKYKLSKIVVISPRYIVENLYTESLQFLKLNSDKEFILNTNEKKPIYGFNKSEKKNLILKFLDSNIWSSPFNLDEVGLTYIKVYKNNLDQVLLKLNIILENATLFVLIKDAKNEWPFVIENNSNFEFTFYQDLLKENNTNDKTFKSNEYKPVFYKLASKSKIPYVYDFPHVLKKRLIIKSHSHQRSINLDEIGTLKPFIFSNSNNSQMDIVDMKIYKNIRSQVLLISTYDPVKSLFKLKKNESLKNSEIFKIDNNNESFYLKTLIKLKGIGISLINKNCQEICYITLRDIQLRYNESKSYQTLALELEWIEVDNQLYGSTFPIIFYPNINLRSEKKTHFHPTLHASICKIKDDKNDFLTFKYVTILMQEINLQIDESFFLSLLDFAKLFDETQTQKDVNDPFIDNSKLPRLKKISDSMEIYFEDFHLQPCLVNFSFIRNEQLNGDDNFFSKTPSKLFFNILTMAIGNINDAPIKLNSLFIKNLRLPLPLLFESIRTHYSQSFIYQIHKILGSADFLGNPVGLFNQISSGVLDIFYEPYLGFTVNDKPQELGIEIAKGGLSFIKKSVFGISDSVSKVTGSLAKGLSLVTLDKKYQERRRFTQKKNKPKHALYGVTSGANSLFESFTSGITGVATAPFEGANQEGTSGFFKGLGKGLIGLPTKTAVGFFDLASNLCEGIKNTTTVFDPEGLNKVRLPRYISHDKIVTPYSHRESQGQFWLKTLDGGVYQNESYLTHLVLSEDEGMILVSFQLVIFFKLNTSKVKWVINLDQVKSISIESTGLIINLKKKNNIFISIPEKSNRDFLYNKMKISVELYNKKYQISL